MKLKRILRLGGLPSIARIRSGFANLSLALMLWDPPETKADELLSNQALLGRIIKFLVGR